MNENWISDLEINNYKSIKNIKMDCRRINVLIGRPNVGKSNILEALALYTAPYADNTKKFLSDYVRYEKLNDLFYFLDRKEQVSIISNLGFAALRFHMNGINGYDFITGPDIAILDSMNQSGSGNSLMEKNIFFQSIVEGRREEAKAVKPYYAEFTADERLHTPFSNNNLGYGSPIKKYHFKSLLEYKNNFPSFLLPPYGNNLFTILEGNPQLWDECAGIFNNYGLDLLLDTIEEKLAIQRRAGRFVTNVPYSLTADTLQRYIFHLAAIETNNNSILLFEEPESHSFPPYISQLASKIIESESNQFFIATHSPYLLTPFIEQVPPGEISIFVARYENYETKIKALSEQEIDNIMETGIDLFFNIPAFQE